MILMRPQTCNIGASPEIDCLGIGAGWNYVTQPNGPTAIVLDYTGKGSGHGFASVSYGVAAVSGAITPFDGDGYWGYNIRFRTTPSTHDAPNYWLSLNGAFGKYLGEGSPNSVDSHPACIDCTARSVWFADARPFLGDSQLTSCIAVTGKLLKCTCARLRRKYLPTLAIVGHQQLTDVSGPSSTIGPATSDAYKYCIAVLSGECVAGSRAGDVYANVGSSSQTGCSYMGVGNLTLI